MEAKFKASLKVGSPVHVDDGTHRLGVLLSRDEESGEVLLEDGERETFPLSNLSLDMFKL